MASTFIDLSVPLEQNSGEPAKFQMKHISHLAGGDVFGKRLAFSKKTTVKQTVLSIFNYLTGKKRITSKSFPDNEFLNLELITISTHTGTHLDAPFHFGSKSEGEQALTIDEIPLEWCYSNGVVLDLSFKKPGEHIQASDIKKAITKIGYVPKPMDIVLIRTGTDRYWGTKDYLTKYPGMSKGALEYVLSFGVKIIGVDSYSIDRPFANMIDDYFQTKNNAVLFPAHFFGRERSYCHIERLTNLDKIPQSYGFKVVCFPIKIKTAGAAWTRVVAIV